MLQHFENLTSQKIVEVKAMTKNTENIIKIDINSFVDMCQKIELLESHVTDLRTENEILRDENETLFETNETLLKELHTIKSLGIWEFANLYCTPEQQGAAGKLLARSLLGKPMTPEEIAIEEAEDCYVPYTAEDF